MANPALAQTSQSTTGFGNLSLAFNGPNTAGNAIIVLVGELSNGDTFSVSDSQGNAYQHLASIVDGVAGSEWQLFYSFGIKAGANTVSFTCSNGVMTAMAIHEFSGITTLDTSMSASGIGTSQDSGGATTTQPIELLFGFTGASGGLLTATAGSGWTQCQNFITSSFGFLTQYQVVNATGTYDSTSTISASKAGVVRWAAEIATFYQSGQLITPKSSYGATIGVFGV
jgi:hypothetical protein